MKASSGKDEFQPLLAALAQNEKKLTEKKAVMKKGDASGNEQSSPAEEEEDDENLLMLGRDVDQLFDHAFEERPSTGKGSEQEFI